MKYEQPFGVSDPNASYINGNPSTGTMGSIPPAASIEHPQREIVNLIIDTAAVVPTEADLHQLGKSIQSGKINYGVDIGVVNAAIVPLLPIPDAYYGGMVVRFKAKFAPTAAATLDAGRGARAIVKSGGAALQGSEWSVGDIVVVTYDDVTSHWTLPPSPIAMLYAPKDYYVNGSTGLDTNDGLTAGTAFKTLQRAQNATTVYNLNGYNITIHVADGAYTNATSPGPVVSCGINNGSGTINYVGNIANPQNVQLTSTAGMCFVVGGTGANVSIDGFRLSSTANAPGVISAGIDVLTGGNCAVKTVNFGSCIDSHISMEGSAHVSYEGPITISGGGSAHISCAQSSYLRQPLNAPSLNITAPVNFPSGFIVVGGGAVTYTEYSSITGFANVSGPKFLVFTNGVIYTNGRGVSFYPGTVAGSQSSGGQYA